MLKQIGPLSTSLLHRPGNEKMECSGTFQSSDNTGKYNVVTVLEINKGTKSLAITQIIRNGLLGGK